MSVTKTLHYGSIINLKIIARKSVAVGRGALTSTRDRFIFQQTIRDPGIPEITELAC